MRTYNTKNSSRLFINNRQSIMMIPYRVNNNLYYYNDYRTTTTTTRYCYCFKNNNIFRILQQQFIIIIIIFISSQLLLFQNHYNNNFVTATSIPYTITMKPYNEQCFLLSIPTNQWISSRKLIGNYEVIHDTEVNSDVNDHANPILVYIMIADIHEQIVWSRVGIPRETFEYELPYGPKAPNRYWICFQNSRYVPNTNEKEPKHPDNHERTIGFTYHLSRTDIASQQISLLLKDINMNDWNIYSNIIHEDLNNIVDYHQYLKLRESNHRSIVEETFNSILNWTLLEAIMVILIAIGQILYFRKYLEK